MAASEARSRAAADQAQLIATIMTELEGIDSEHGRALRLTELLVPAVADFVTVEAPDADQPLLAAAHVDPAKLPVLRELRTAHRLPRNHPASVVTLQPGRARLIQVTPRVIEESTSDATTADLLAGLGSMSMIKWFDGTGATPCAI